ncbi:cation-transporting P-type ATPase [Patescibacteria group bacterium]|nr:MAG: cation-transporting P-type ATPase [Patescibacteria group bacterium]
MKKTGEKKIYNLEVNEVLEKFQTTSHGIANDEAGKRLKQVGPNRIDKRRSWKGLHILLGQFNDALVWILLIAAGLAAYFQEYRDATIIGIIIFINATVGFLQEFRSERILESIKRLTTDQAIVIRSGERREIDAAEIVPGDVVVLSAGDSVPADGYLLESYDLRINSFIFTGESKPRLKTAKALKEENVVLADINNMVFGGETVATGEGNFVVTATGMATELGRIANLTAEVKEEATPLQQQMRILGRNVTILAFTIGALVVIIGQYFHLSLYQNFLFALALAVSVVPEGLPAAISVALSLGMRRLLKDNVLAKKLNAVETLGSVSIICTDKTGTITRNELTVVKVIVNGQELEVGGVGYAPEGSFYQQGKVVNQNHIPQLELLFRIGTLCNGASLLREEGGYKIVGDPTEGAIIVAGRKYNQQDHFFELGETKLTENPFSSDRMRMSVVYKNAATVSYVKGSPDVLLERAKWMLRGGKVVKFTPKEKELERERYNAMSSEALRVLAFAYRNLEGVSPQNYPEEAERELVWVGMMAMIDPPRNDVAEAIRECKRLGIKPIMITGDYEITARAIAKNVGLIEGEGTYELINGSLLAGLKDREVYQRIKTKDVIFARISPEQKLRIASILKANRQIIAMTGDGVNDAPALKRADIGVAMGIMGTDVSKEAADMILLDDNFASIVKGIQEGRTVYQNLRKFVHYVFTSNASELFTVILGVLLQIPSPISAVQILAIDLGTDIFPSFALSFEPPEPGESRKKSTNAKYGIMSVQGFWRIIFIGLLMAAGAAAAFIWSMLRGGWTFGTSLSLDSELYIRSTTAAYAVLSMTQMANVLQSRSDKYSPTTLGFFKNKYVIGAIIISVLILLAFMYLPFCQHYLRMLPIQWPDWLMVIGTTMAVYFFEEARKGEGR